VVLCCFAFIQLPSDADFSISVSAEAIQEVVPLEHNRMLTTITLYSSNLILAP